MYIDTQEPIIYPHICDAYMFLMQLCTVTVKTAHICLMNGLHLQDVISMFYFVCTDAWCKLRAKNFIIKTKKTFCVKISLAMSIYLVAIKQKQSIFYSNWTKNGLFTKRDICDEERNQWLEGNEIYIID